MGIELFGGHLTLPLAVACTLAFIASGPRGIYSSQKRATETPASP